MSETISIRTNLYLWLLTGRAGDFFNSSLNTGVRYNVADTPAEVEEVRELLNLGDTLSDFYVLGALSAALMSTSLIRTLPSESDAVFRGGLLELPPVSSTQLMLPPDSRSWPSVGGGRAGTDGFTEITFSYVDASTALIQTNNGGEEVTGVVVSPLEGGDVRITFAKAAEYGIFADFRAVTWTTGSSVTVTVSPSRYPYAHFAHLISQNTTAIHLMTAEGTMQGFSESSNPARRVGMLALAIIRRMIKHTNDDQAGFSVTSSVGEDLSRTFQIEPTLVAHLEDPECEVDEPVGFNA